MNQLFQDIPTVSLVRAQSNDLVIQLDSLSIRLVDRVIEKTFATIPSTLSSLTLLIVALALILFGIPFTLGLIIGRLARRKNL